MNFILVKHPKCSQLYLFRVPEHIRMSPFIEVNCETRYGIMEGTTVVPSFEIPDEAVERLCDLYGTRPADLKFVKSVIEKKEIDLEDTDTLRALAKECGECEEEDSGEDDEEEEEDEYDEERELLAYLGHLLVSMFDNEERKRRNETACDC